MRKEQNKMSNAHRLQRLLSAVIVFSTSAICHSADWQIASRNTYRSVEIDHATLVWHGSRARMWVWFAPTQQPVWRLLLGDSSAAISSSREYSEVNCYDYSYRILELEGLPRSARHLGRAERVLPGSDEEDLLNWLCHG